MWCIFICVCVYIYIQSYLWVGSYHCKKALSHTLDLTFRGEEWATAPAPPAGHVFFPNDKQLWDGYHCPPKVRSKNRFQSVPLQMLISYEFSYDIHPSCSLMLLDAGCISRFGMIWDDHHTPQVVSKRLRSAHKSLLSAVVDRDGFSAKTGGPTLPVGTEMWAEPVKYMRVVL